MDLNNLRETMGTLPSQSPELKTEFVKGAEGIKVELIDYNRNPYKAMYVLATSCWGSSINKWAETSPENRFLVVKAVLERQALPLALEVPNFTFAVEGPSRAAFDQLARTRVGAVFSAKGMRDNNWKDASIRVPSSLWPSEEEFSLAEIEDPTYDTRKDAIIAAKDKVTRFNKIKETLSENKAVYADIVDVGKGSWQAARSVLNLYVVYGYSVCYNYSSLRNVCANRMKFCLTDINDIQLADGTIKSIAEVIPGDMVLTENGSYEPVLKTSKRDYSGNIFTILTSGTPENKPLQLTEGHKVMAVDTSIYRGKTGLVTKPLYKQNLNPEWIESQNLKRGDLIAYPIVTEETNQLFYDRPVTEDMAKAFGYFISEGYTSDYQIRMSFGPTERGLAEDCISSFRSAFNVQPYLRDHTIGKYQELTNTLVVEIGSKELAEQFKESFGKLATGKHLPSWFIYLPKKTLVAFYEAYKAGDGSTITVNKGNSDIIYDSFTTVSESLAFQLKNMALKLGYYPSIGFAKYDDKIEILGRMVNQHSKYIITVYHDTLGSKGSRCFRSTDGKYMLYMIKSIEEDYMDTLVYNLEVKDVHSYTTIGQLVHNCEMEDVVATAWLMANEVSNVFPLLGSYLRPGCDFAHKCQYHKSYYLSELFGCLFKECGRNACDNDDGYAEFNETCTDVNVLENQTHLHITRPSEWIDYTWETLSERDKELFSE